MTFEETLVLMKLERAATIEDILDGIAKLRPEWVEDQYGTGYTDALNDVIDMILAKDKEK